MREFKKIYIINDDIKMSIHLLPFMTNVCVESSPIHVQK